MAGETEEKKGVGRKTGRKKGEEQRAQDEKMKKFTSPVIVSHISINASHGRRLCETDICLRSLTGKG